MANANFFENENPISVNQGTSTSAYLSDGAGFPMSLPNQALTTNIDRFMLWIDFKEIISHWLGLKKIIETSGQTYDADNSAQLDFLSITASTLDTTAAAAPGSVNRQYTLDISSGNVTITLGDGNFVGQEISFIGSGGNTGYILYTGIKLSSDPGMPVSDGDKKVLVWDGAKYILNAYDISNIVPGYDPSEAVLYETKGFIIDRFGTHYSSSGKTGNSGKDPANPQSDTWWIPSEGWDNYKKFASKGESIPGGMHPWTDFSSGNYQQNIKLDEIIRGGVTYDVHGVILDGTQVTLDATLEAIFDPGGAKEYPWIDEFAPDNLGTRTLIDMRGRSTRAMTAGGGVAATLAEVQEDEFQGHWHETVNKTAVVTGGAADAIVLGSGATTEITVDDAVTDTVNGTPRTGLETRVKALVRGVDYIIVIIAQ